MAERSQKRLRGRSLPPHRPVTVGKNRKFIEDSNSGIDFVLVVTSSDSVRDREAVKALGFDGYFRKPSVYAEFMKLGPMIRELLTGAPDEEA